uniref:Uncharacterized protein n=1 Tax=Romanomermis culicivorax TaxID=13658 RepID=A0A915HW08_ROMCU
MTPPLNVLIASARASTDSMSKLLVANASSNQIEDSTSTSHPTNVATFFQNENKGFILATNLTSTCDILIRQPPEKCFVARSCISLVNCRPDSILRALDSAESAPMALNSSYT